MDVRLVQFAERHLPAFERMLDDPDVKRFTRLPVPTPSGFPRTWLERYEQGRRDGTSEAFAIVDDAGGFLGCVMAFGIETDEGKAELGYMVAPAARGRGVATEALRLLTGWGFTDARPDAARASDQRRQHGVDPCRRAGRLREGRSAAVALRQGRPARGPRALVMPAERRPARLGCGRPVGSANGRVDDSR